MKKWHIWGWLAWLCIFILVIIALYTELQPPDKPGNGKLIEIQGSVLRGFDHGHLSWQVVCQYMWAGQNKSIFLAQKIHKGQVLDKSGETILKNIVADNIQVNSEHQSFLAQNNLSAQFLQRLKEESKNPQLITITADEFQYLGDANQGFFRRRVILKKGKSQIIPKNNLEIDTDKNIASIQQGFTMISPQFITSGNVMSIDIDQDVAELTENLYIIRKADTLSTDAKKTLDPREKTFRLQRSFITCDSLMMTKEATHNIINAQGHIHAWQGDKHLTGDQGHYSEKDHLFILENHVQFQAKTLGWILDSRRKKTFKNKDMLKALGMPIDVRCQKVEFNSALKTLVLQGKVVITQPDKEIHCEKLVYTDSDNVVTLEGNVVIEKENADTFRCESLRLDLEKEAFSAKSSVRSLFKLKKPSPF